MGVGSCIKIRFGRCLFFAGILQVFLCKNKPRIMCQAAPAFSISYLPVPERAPALSALARKTPDSCQAHYVFHVIRLGFEPKTHSLEGCCSIQLSYRTDPCREQSERESASTHAACRTVCPFSVKRDCKDTIYFGLTKQKIVSTEACQIIPQKSMVCVRVCRKSESR